MPIIQSKTSPATLSDFQGIVATQISATATSLLNQMIANYRLLFGLVWKHPKLTPQQVLDAIGTDAVQLFTLGALLQATILEASPQTILPSVPNQIVFNVDGTIKVGELIPTIDPLTGVDTNAADISPTLLSKLTSGIAGIFKSFFSSGS